MRRPHSVPADHRPPALLVPMSSILERTGKKWTWLHVALQGRKLVGAQDRVGVVWDKNPGVVASPICWAGCWNRDPAQA